MSKNKTPQTFHAVLHVTRAEEWCVEAASLEEARALLAAGAGYRCHLGDCLHVEVEHIEGEEVVEIEDAPHLKHKAA